MRNEAVERQERVETKLLSIGVDDAKKLYLFFNRRHFRFQNSSVFDNAQLRRKRFCAALSKKFSSILKENSDQKSLLVPLTRNQLEFMDGEFLKTSLLPEEVKARDVFRRVQLAYEGIEIND